MLTTIFFTIIFLTIISIAFYFLIWKRVSDSSDIIKLLTKQSTKWSSLADQDTNPIISAIHANYGVGYLWAIKDITDDAQFRITTGMNLVDYEKNIINIQEKSIKKLIDSCKNITPDNTNLIKTMYGSNS